MSAGWVEIRNSDHWEANPESQTAERSDSAVSNFDTLMRDTDSFKLQTGELL